jgi:adenylate cyclase
MLTSAAITLMFTGDIDTAVTLIDRAVQINPNHAQAWSSSGWIRVVLGNPDLAIEHSLKALQLNPLGTYQFLTLTPLAVSYFLTGRDEEARSWADRALADNPNQLPTLRFVAAIKAANGQLEEAKKIVCHILELSPQDKISQIPVIRHLRRPDYRQKLVDAMLLAGLPY